MGDAMSDYLDPNNEELLKDFFVEAQLQVESLESNILVLENEPTNHDAIDEIFRAAHTLKGASATVQMLELSEFTHLVEDVLDRVRGDALHVTEDIIDLFLTSIDIVKEMLAARQNAGVFDQDISETQGRLRRLLQTAEAPAAGAEPEASSAEATSTAPTTTEASSAGSSGAPAAELSEYDALELREAAEGNPVYRVRVHFNEDNPMNTVGGIQVFASLKRQGTVLKTDPEFEKLYEDAFFPVVDYFLATEEDTESLADAIKIPDVTLDIGVEAIDGSAKAEARTPDSTVQEPRSSATQPDESDEPAEAREPVPAEEAPGGTEEALARAGARGAGCGERREGSGPAVPARYADELRFASR